MIKINLGCGARPFVGKEWVNVDSGIDFDMLRAKKGPFSDAPDYGEDTITVIGDALNLPFPDNYADYLESQDMVEHLPFYLQPALYKEMFRVLKPGGELRVSTVDFSSLARIWLEEVDNNPNVTSDDYVNVQEMIYGNQFHDGEYHKTAYSPTLASTLLNGAGFTDVTITIYPRFSLEFPPLYGCDSVREHQKLVAEREKDQEIKTSIGCRSDVLYLNAFKPQ